MPFIFVSEEHVNIAMCTMSERNKTIIIYIFVSENDNNQNKSAWWKPGIEIFSQVSTWIVVPIILALVVGKGLDSHYGTKPIIFLVFAGLGFLFSCFGIVRVVKDYIKKLKDISPDQNQDSDKSRGEMN